MTAADIMEAEAIPTIFAPIATYVISVLFVLFLLSQIRQMLEVIKQIVRSKILKKVALEHAVDMCACCDGDY